LVYKLSQNLDSNVNYNLFTYKLLMFLLFDQFLIELAFKKIESAFTLNNSPSKKFKIKRDI